MSSDFGREDHDVVALGHVEGLRWWRLEDQPAGPGLHGHYGAWVPGVSQADCRASFGAPIHTAPAPQRGCACGFWAYWHLASGYMVGAPHVAGIIKGHGKVIKGPLGFRAGTAEIIALAPLDCRPELAGTLEARYGAPVYSSVAAMLEMHKAPPTQPALADARNEADRIFAGGTSRAMGGPVTSVTFSSGNVNLNTAGGMNTYRAMGGGGGSYSYSYYYGGSGGGYTSGGSSAGGQGGATWNPVYQPMYQPLCRSCGRWCATAGLCPSCELAHEALQEAQAAISKATTGTDALDQLHTRREQWAKDAVQKTPDLASKFQRALGHLPARDDLGPPGKGQG